MAEYAQYDLTQKLVPHIDRHLAIPLLSHLAETGLFPADQIVRAQYDLAKGTNMVDYVKSLHEQVGSGASGSASEPRDFERLKNEATSRYAELQEKAGPVMQVIEDPEAVAKFKSGLDRERIVQLLEKEYNVSRESTPRE
jgi:translation initiation factor 3 subunit E